MDAYDYLWYIYIYKYWNIGEYKCGHLFFNMLFIRSHIHPGSWTEKGLSQFHPGLGYIDLYLPLGMDMADGLGKHDNPVRLVVFLLRCGDISFGMGVSEVWVDIDHRSHDWLDWLQLAISVWSTLLIIAMIHRHKHQLSHHHEPSISILGKWNSFLLFFVTICTTPHLAPSTKHEHSMEESQDWWLLESGESHGVQKVHHQYVFPYIHAYIDI